MPYLTENQKKAHDVHRHISVVANAGSGKTTVLVERYVDIIQYGHATAHEVVALTFTEKAAGEIRRRIAETIRRRYSETGDQHERNRLEMLREQLSSAIIGTIHSFCARLLREYPVDVPTPEWGGIDASFTIIEGIDRQSLMGEATSEVFQKILGQPNHDYRIEFLDCVRMLGRNTVVGIIHQLLAKREVTEHFVRGYSRPDSEILFDWNAVIDRYLDGILAAPALAGALRECAGRISRKKKTEVQNALDAFYSATVVNTRVEAFSTLFQLFLRQSYEPRSGIFEGVEECRDALVILQTAARAVKPIAGAIAGRDDAHRLLIRTSRTIIAVMQEILKAYNRRKAENAQLDFEDLQIYVKALLSIPDIGQKLSKTFTHIMVDEFQDTNRLQYEILLPLIDNFTAGNLFIVGDPKQSIYGFRNAEVEIFMRAIREITAHANHSDPFSWRGTMIESTETERAGEVILAESFRLLPAIAAFVNMVFSRCMNPAVNRFSVPYDPLIVARVTPAPGRVELLFAPEDMDDPEAEMSSYGAEEEMIARRVLALYHEGYTITDRRTDESRPIRFGDVAILLRSRTNLHRLEQALLHYGIPHAIYGGEGFYQTQELYDFFNYFQFLLNPHDDTALAGILRSPFFSCSDASLYRISLLEEGNDFWTKACVWAGRNPDTDPRVTRAVNILRQDLLRAGRQSLTDCILEVIHRTGYGGIAAASHRAAQHSANVKKFLQLARSFEARGFSNLYDFVERLRVLIEGEETEGQASIDETENAVHIMTIHAAKGLEFGAVVVPYLHKKFHYDNEPFIDPRGYLGYSLVSPEDFDKEMNVPLTQMLRQENRRKTEAEEQRIFYVACTRARDLLILAGIPPRQSGQVTAMRWVLDGLEIDAPGERGRVVRDVPLRKVVLSDGRYEVVDQTYPLSVEWFCHAGEFAVAAVPGPGVVVPAEIPKVQIYPIPSGEEGEFYSATQIKTYHDCPLKYHFLYHLGMAEVHREPYHYHEEEEENDDTLSSTAYGTLCHRVLEKILSPDAVTSISTIVQQTVVENDFSSRKGIQRTVERVEQEVRAFCASEIGRRALHADEVFTEYRLDGILGNDFITGTIDRLTRTSTVWEVIDYKTDSMNNVDLTGKIEAYRYQMMVYAWLVSRSTGQNDVPVSLFFTDMPDASSTSIIAKDEIQRFELEMARVIRDLREMRISKNLTHCQECPFSRNGLCIQE